jgi:riboflavin kinase/FMN adenylyltransferase
MRACYVGSAAYPPDAASLAVAVGNFDGVHLGHRAVIRRLRAEADRLGVPAAVYTFDPAPTAVLAPERHQPRLLPLSERVQRLHDAGVDVVVVEPFTRAWAGHPAEWFVDVVLQARLRARALVVGHDFRFGSGRAGDAALVRQRAPSLAVHVVDAVQQEGAPVSSSRVRQQVSNGAVEAAARLLGRPHLLSGTVVHGDKRGRTLGFPTANLLPETELLPSDGVYAVRAGVDDAEPSLPAVMNIGVRPTVDGSRRSVEVHLLDRAEELYGHTLRVEVVARLREERRFEGLDALVAQIRADVDAARGRLG